MENGFTMCQTGWQHLVACGLHLSDGKEDLNDLRMEGVTTLVPSGSKFNQGRPTYPAEPQAKVTLNICSRCARLQGDNLAERTEEALPVLHSPDEKIPDSFDSLPGTEEALMEEGEEFEKASVVMGPGEASSGGGYSLKNYMEEDESLKQLQVVHQPWILPSDTESEGVETLLNQNLCDWDSELCIFHTLSSSFLIYK
uniref:Chromosome 8 open reading frame 34 n=1 Tax=Cebus imitator TaxID=2715852 RepID=A0A2K5SEX9_CEBIM